ncbi:pectate lyase domain-containing protein [Rhizoctonia solani AG-1 IA]|uniref:pectin lyase n=1 Tax=Thanatephorus cucumeris (strain AG1-IA) TaxID=983506 RepID=L8WMJ6_THACA|nr:pectate lyase domain-containing protein [Rhizoctonia solani AG-1 IA]
MFFIGSLAAILVASQGALAVGSPFGFATGTTGGSSAAPATPTSTSQLASWLSDSTTRTILLDRTYDFTDTEGSVTGPGCKPWACSPNPQQSLDGNGWCSSTAPKTTITYKKAGTTALAVGSNKTILGKGNSGWIKGKGLRLAGSKNVIIQNIRISDINPQYVWGGDAIDLSGATNVWHWPSIPRFGTRLPFFLVLTPLTKSECSTLNRTPKLPFLTTTLMDNRPGPPAAISTTTGLSSCSARTTRLPLHATMDVDLISVVPLETKLMHMYNNYFNDITGHALDADVGGTVLAEGNYFNKVKTPSTGNVNGAVFAPTSATMANQCSTSLGRNGGGSGALTNTAKNSIVSQFTASVVKSASIMDPSTVASYVLANAGTGKFEAKQQTNLMRYRPYENGARCHSCLAVYGMMAKQLTKF